MGKLRDNAEISRGAISPVWMFLVNGWDIAKSISYLAVISLMYLEISRWVVSAKKGQAGSVATVAALGNENKRGSGASAETTSMHGGDQRPQETRADEAPAPRGLRIRAPMGDIREETDVARESMEIPSETARSLEGQARRARGPLPVRIAVRIRRVGRLFPNEGDLVSDREQTRDAFFFAQHGQEYTMLVNNRRRGHAQRWGEAASGRRTGDGYWIAITKCSRMRRQERQANTIQTPH